MKKYDLIAKNVLLTTVVFIEIESNGNAKDANINCHFANHMD